MQDLANDGEFASVVWDTTDTAPSGSSTSHQQNVENPLDHGRRDDAQPSTSTAAGVVDAASRRRSTSSGPSSATRNQHDKADGRYFVQASVVEPQKMLENTKDAYVSYGIRGEVSGDVNVSSIVTG